ncbi:hypothetical protein KI387_014506, partial [Taxus chinensis]
STHLKKRQCIHVGEERFYVGLRQRVQRFNNINQIESKIVPTQAGKSKPFSTQDSEGDQQAIGKESTPAQQKFNVAGALRFSREGKATFQQWSVHVEGRIRFHAAKEDKDPPRIHWIIRKRATHLIS